MMRWLKFMAGDQIVAVERRGDVEEARIGNGFGHGVRVAGLARRADAHRQRAAHGVFSDPLLPPFFRRRPTNMKVPVASATVSLGSSW